MGKYSDCWTYPMEVIDEKFDHVVSKDTTVNNKPLSGNVTLTAEDVGAIAQEIGSWTPSIPRATLSNVTGKYIKSGKVVIAIASCDVTASESSNAYIEWESLPIIPSTRPIFGQWQCGAGTAGELGEDGGNNNNQWFSQGGVRMPLTNMVNNHLSFIIIYIID